MGRFMQYFIYFLIGLAVFGLGTYLVKNPVGLFMTLALTAIVAFVIFKVLSYFLNKRYNNGYTGGRQTDEMKKYKQAVKQSKKKYAGKNIYQSSKQNKKETIKKKKKRRHAPHLRVIDGKKGSNKNDRVL